MCVGMWRKRVAVVVASVAWGAAGSHALPGLPYWMSPPGMVFVLSVAICATMYAALKCHQRPIAVAFDLGYEMGRREAIRDMNRRDPSPLRAGDVLELADVLRY